ncbi:MAG TPA: IPT/TIG domain-containing protein [Chthonomonadaceae bacterium]|nr:IPT/TIG domain-containing protein [Chthonomonadaceae bacterium]
MLYGTTADGGPSWTGANTGHGTVFQISRDGGVFNTLHAFDGTDGADPISALLPATDGLLYGTTRYGGPDFTGSATGGGTAFQMSLNGSVFNSFYSFGASSTDAANPICGLREGPDGNLYGISGTGGANGSGAVYLLPTQLPIIKGFSPTSGSASAGTIVSVRGVNLESASAITIAGVAQTILSKTATAVKFKLAAATPTGSYTLFVTTPNGTATSARTFTVDP